MILAIAVRGRNISVVMVHDNAQRNKNRPEGDFYFSFAGRRLMEISLYLIISL